MLLVCVAESTKQFEAYLCPIEYRGRPFCSGIELIKLELLSKDLEIGPQKGSLTKDLGKQF